MMDPAWEARHSAGYGNPFPSEEVMGFVHFKKPDRLLDIGCGTGWNLRYAEQCGVKVAGVDGSPSAINVARELLGDTADLRVLELPATLPWADDSFDAALDIECLYCLPVDQATTMYNEIHRVLKPGGSCLIRAHMEDSWRRFEIGKGIDGEELKYRTRSDIKQMLEKFTISNVFTLVRDYGSNRAIKEWVITATK